MGYVFKMSLSENLRLKWLITAGCAFLFVFIMGNQWGTFNASTTPEATFSVLAEQFVFRIVALFAAIYSVAIVSGEVEQKTIVYWTTRPIPRGKFIFARFLAAGSVVAIFSCLMLIAAAFGSRNGFSGAFLGDLAAVVGGSFAYTAFFLAISLFLNRAMLFCLIYSFGWETASSELPGELYRSSVNSYMKAVAQHTAAADPVSAVKSGLSTQMQDAFDKDISVLMGYGVLAGIIVLGVIFSASYYATHEYIPRENAE